MKRTGFIVLIVVGLATAAATASGHETATPNAASCGGTLWRLKTFSDIGRMAGAPDAGGDDHRRHRQEGFPAPCAQASPHSLPAPGLGGGRAGDAVPTREWRPASGALRRRLLSERGHTATELPLRKDTSPTAARSGVEAVRRRVRATNFCHGSPLARLSTSAGSASGVRNGRSRGQRETARSYIL